MDKKQLKLEKHEKMIQLRSSGKTYKEIATIMNCSEWTVKYHTMPCRKKAQDHYNKYYGAH